MSIKHLKVSAKADGPDPGNVHASDWNAVHDLSALVAGDVSDFAEAVDDRVSALLKQGANVTLTYDDVAGTLTIAASGGAATTPGGATTQLQFNDGGAFAGDADLVWDKTGNVLTLNGTLKGATSLKLQPGATGDILLDGGRGAALSPTATSGFVTLPTTTAPPTGVPVNALTGAAPTVYDATNNKLWFYLKGSAPVVTWNPADKSPNCILSNGNLTTSSSTTDNGPARATVGKSSGKWAWETRYDSGVTPIFGIGLSSVPLTDFPGYNPNSWSFYGKSPAEKITSGVHTAYGSPFATTHIVTTLLDMDAGTLEWWLDGVTMGVAFTGLTGTIYPMIGSSGSGVSVSTTNFGATAFTYALPVGFAGIGGTGAATGTLTIAGTTSAASTITSAVPAGAVAGDLLILILLDGSTTTIPMSAGFTALSTAGVNAGSIGWRIMQAGDTTFPTVGSANRYSTMVALHSSSGSPSIDQFASTFYTASGTFATPVATPTTPTDVSLMIFTSGQGVFSSTLPTPPYTALINQTVNGQGTCGMVVTSTILASAAPFSGCTVPGLGGAGHNGAAFHVLVKGGGGVSDGWVTPTPTPATYPIAIGQGGTGATDAPTALTNLGGTATGTGVFTAATAAAARAVLGAESSIAGGTTAQYWRGDKAWTTLDKVAVGLGNVDNTSDVGKPVSTAQAAADALRVLKAGDSMSGALLLSDGTVAAPGLAFNSEPGLGWYRYAASTIAVAAQGQFISAIDASSATGTNFTLRPRSASGVTGVFLTNQPFGAGNYNALSIYQNADGSALIQAGAAGTATRGNLTLDAPVTNVTGGLSVAPGTTFVQATFGTDMKIWQSASNMQFLFTSQSGFIFTPSGGTLQYLAGGVENFQSVFGSKLFINQGAAQKPGGGPWDPIASDARIKRDIEPYTRGLEDILAYRPVQFRYLDGYGAPGDDVCVGRLAHEVEAVDPSMVIPSQAKSDFGDLKTYKMDTDIYKIINAIKTLHERLSHLELHPA